VRKNDLHHHSFFSLDDKGVSQEISAIARFRVLRGGSPPNHIHHHLKLNALLIHCAKLRWDAASFVTNNL
jgi:hypothetical protein